MPANSRWNLIRCLKGLNELMTDIGDIPLVQRHSNADLASNITWGHFYNVTYARIFMKADLLDINIDLFATYRPEAAAGLTVHTSGPFVPLPRLRLQLDLPSPCHHVCFTTMCKWITWNLLDWVSAYMLAAREVWLVGELFHFVMAADKRSVQNVSIPCWLYEEGPCDGNTVGTQFIQNVCSAVTTVRNNGSSGMLRSADW